MHHAQCFHGSVIPRLQNFHRSVMPRERICSGKQRLSLNLQWEKETFSEFAAGNRDFLWICSKQFTAAQAANTSYGQLTSSECTSSPTLIHAWRLKKDLSSEAAQGVLCERGMNKARKPWISLPVRKPGHWVTMQSQELSGAHQWSVNAVISVKNLP